MPDGVMAEGITGDWHEENASVEVWRWGRAVRLAIRSEDSAGKAVELTLAEARTIGDQLLRAATPQGRLIRDEPLA
ncbi:MAG: hypothetical protein KGL39_53335 [Patescibacteria group bacterium]|nr:hypothetical protein [Patescibacteria group bacterium]